MQVQDDDELISLSRTAVECLVEGKVQGRFWIEYFPWLRYVPPCIPGSSARKYGRRFKPIVMAMRDQPFDATLQATVSHSVNDNDAYILTALIKINNTVTSSVAQRLINKLQALPVGTDEYKRHEQIARDAAGIAYAGASRISFHCSFAHHHIYTIAAVDTVSLIPSTPYSSVFTPAFSKLPRCLPFSLP